MMSTTFNPSNTLVVMELLFCKVSKYLNSSRYEDSKKIINLSLYECTSEYGDIKDTEHIAYKWCDEEEVNSLDFAELDKELLDDVLDCFPSKIVGEPEKYDYLELLPADKIKRNIQKDAEDFERSQRKKNLHGKQAEDAVVLYEKDYLNNHMRPDLANLVKKVSKNISLGYDVLSFSIKGNICVEKHIEVKFVQKTANYISFFFWLLYGLFFYL